MHSFKGKCGTRSMEGKYMELVPYIFFNQFASAVNYIFLTYLQIIITAEENNEN